MDNSHNTGGSPNFCRRAPRPVSVGRILAYIVAALILGKAFLMDAAVVQGRSMLPGLASGDIVMIAKAAYGLRNPFGGYFFLWKRPADRDIVAAIRPDSGKIIIKRVRIEEGPGLNRDSDAAGRAHAAEYFLLGDNKYESIDSREFGPVPMNNILGEVLVILRF